MSLRANMRYMNPYEVHKTLVNEYILQRPGDTHLLKRDCSKDRTDADVLRDNHKFLWDDENAPGTWEEQFARKYYDKLFKEYCLGDLSRYKENKVALRWRTEQEVVIGKGQFICGNKVCSGKDDLKTWEVNFAYMEKGEKKNALIKIRLCPTCSEKLNYYSKKREVKRLNKNKLIGHKKKRSKHKETSGSDNDEALSDTPGTSQQQENLQTEKGSDAENLWENVKPVETKSREEEMEDYLEELLL